MITTRHRRGDAAAPRPDANDEGLIARAPLAMYRTTPEGEVLRANPALARLLGYPDLDTLREANAADTYLDPEDRRRWQERVHRADGPVVFHMRDRRYDGRIIQVRDVAWPVRDPAGRLVCYEGVLEELANGLGPDPASGEVGWSWDVDSGRVAWCDALFTAFGYEPSRPGPSFEQSYGWWSKRIHPDERRRVTASLRAALLGDARSWRSRYRFRHIDGSYRDVLDHGRIERDGEGRPTRLEGRMIDLACDPVVHGAAEALDPMRPPLPPTRDEHLVRWVARGEERALEELWRRHHDALLHRVLTSGVAEAGDAEEAVSDVFVQVWAKAEDYDAARGSVEAWLRSIARSRSLDRVRKRARRQELLSELGSHPFVMPTPRPTERVHRERTVRRALARLSPIQKEAVELVYLAGLTHREAAERLNVPLGTAKTRIRDGLRKLRREMANGA